jgi:ABC-2 type transport system ATP-binding protein
MIIDVVDLKKYYGAVKAVDGVSFGFGAGRIFGFVGPNGAGKTTTMRILASLEEPTGGDVRLDGVSLVEEPEKAHRYIGYVPDSLPGHRDVTVHEYLDFFARAYGLRGDKRRGVVERIEEFTNLIGLREKELFALSKGMKNRVSVARALVHDPPVLVMDEPAAGLDPRARIELRELLRVLAGQGKAVLISSHILSELAEVCDGAVIIERGKILRAGSLEELAAKDAPYRTYIVRSLEPQDELVKRLLEMPGVQSARPAEQAVEAELAGTEEDAAALLAGLVRAGLAVTEFRPRRADLEQIFLSATTGEVQ